MGQILTGTAIIAHKEQSRNKYQAKWNQKKLVRLKETFQVFLCQRA